MKNGKLTKIGMIASAIILALVLWTLPTNVRAEDSDNATTMSDSITSILISGHSTMIIGEEQTLKAYPFPADNPVDVEWTSSDPSVATVDSNGKVKAITVGSSSITAKTTDGCHSDTFHVTVYEAAVESVIINPSEVWVIKSDIGPYDLSVSVQPSNSCQIVWWPENKYGDVQVNEVIDEDDNITGYHINGGKVGTFEVPCVSYPDIDVYTYLTVHVCDPTTSLTLKPKTLNLEVGEESTINATILPETACPNLTWTSSNDKVVKVTDGKVTAIAAGTATITATSLDGKTATCKVSVKDAAAEDQSVIVYRLYNPCTGEHLYTTDSHEKDVLYQSHGWGFEGIGWYSPSSGEKVYRLFQPGLDNHLYTTDVNEVKVLTTKYGWVEDNNGDPIFYSGGDVPIYRVYNKGLRGMHHLTTDLNEYKTLPKYGWQQEGLKLYAKALGSPTSITQYYKK